VVATGGVFYQSSPTATATQVASLGQANAANGLNASYTITRPGNARAGLYSVHVTLTDPSGQSSQGQIPFTVACPAPTVTLTSAVGIVGLPNFSANGTYGNSDVCAGPLTATLQAFALADVGNTTVLSSGTVSTPAVLVAGVAPAPMVWSLPALPVADYRLVATVINADGVTSASTELALSVNCPSPTFYAMGVSQESGLTAASGLVLLSNCSNPSAMQVQVSGNGGLPTLSLPVTLYQSVGLLTYYSFDYPLAGVANGNYTMLLSATDGNGATGTGTALLVVDRGNPTAALTVNGQPSSYNSGTAESLGRFGYKPGATGLPSASKL
jgi:hypothetical protein